MQTGRSGQRLSVQESMPQRLLSAMPSVMKISACLVFLLLPLIAHAKGPVITLSDFHGRPVPFAEVQRDATLVAFWSAACVPCIEEMPLLDGLYKKLSDHGHFTVIGVNLDENDDLPAAQKILAERKVAYPMLRDPQRQLVRQWFPNKPDELGLPTVLVVDRQFHALYSQGFQPGMSSEAFIAAWSPRLSDARNGKLREPLQRLAPQKAEPASQAQMAQMIEKMVRSHHPELSDTDVKVRVEAALREFQSKDSFSIE